MSALPGTLRALKQASNLYLLRGCFFSGSTSILFKIFGIFFLLCGVFGIAAFFYLAYTSHEFSSRAVSTQGTVIDLEERSSSSGSRRPTYGAMVKFRSQDGEPHVFGSRYSSNPPPHEIGEIVTVHYDPENPRSAIVYNSFWSLWFYPLIPLFLGPIFVVLGIVFLKLSPRF